MATHQDRDHQPNDGPSKRAGELHAALDKLNRSEFDKLLRDRAEELTQKGQNILAVVRPGNMSYSKPSIATL